MTEQLGGSLEMKSPRELGADRGSRMMGWLVPPVTGEYVFWIAADHLSELWLSTVSEIKTNRTYYTFQIN